MSNFDVIPDQAIEHLLANPGTKDQFDQVFGKGNAARVLAERHPELEPVEEQDESLSFIGKVWDATGRAVGYGAQEAVNETVDAIESFDNWASNKLDEWGVPSRLQLTDAEGNFSPAFKYNYEVDREDSLLGNVEINAVSKPQTITGGIVSGVSQFAVGFIGAGKFTRLGGLRGAFVNGAIADALVFDPNDPNVMKMLEQFDVDTGALGEVLATDPDDPEYINRLRNVGEGAAFGGIVEAIGWSIKAARAAKAGDDVAVKAFTAKQEAALKELDDAMAEAAKEVTEDATKSLDLAKKVFDPIEADGQMRLDLGDQNNPATRVAEATEPSKGRIYITPEQHARMDAWAEGAPWFNRNDRWENLSFRSLTTQSNFEDVVGEIRAASTVLADKFEAIKGGNTQRWTTVKAQAAAKLREMAEMTGEDPEAIVSRFMQADFGDPAKLAAEVHARGNYLLTVEQELKQMLLALKSGQFDPKQFPGIRDMDHLRLAINQRREVAANLLGGFDATRSNLARAMNAMKMANKGDEGLREMLRDPSQFRDIDALAEAVAANPDAPAVRTINETLSKLHGVADRVNTFRINALLSGPGTQEVNLISNVVNSFVIPAEQALGGAVTGDVRMMKHALKQLQGTILGLRENVQLALKAGYYDEALLDNITKIEGDDLRGAVTGYKPVDNTIKLPSRFLMMQDEFFKQGQYRGRVFADAHTEAAEKGLEGTAKTDFIKQYIKDSYDDAGMATRPDALLQARRATFTEPLEGTVAIGLQNMAIQSPYIRFILPFVRTPINILSQTFQHAPALGFASKRLRDDLAAGGVRAAQALGRQIVGTSLVAMAGYMAASGQITGGGPTDPRIRKVWLKNNQPYAFRVVNEDGTVSWISYARLEPLSNIFSIAADAVEIMGDEYNESERTHVIQALLMAAMENTVNKTFTQGIADAMDAFNGEPHAQKRALNNFVASFVPNVLNQTNGDDVMREARTLTDNIMARTHLYNGVDPKRNVLGEPVVRTLPKYDPLGFTESDTREIDTVLEEVTRMAILNQSVADNPAKRLSGPNGIDLTEIPYKEGQSLYDRWIELTGEVKIGGKTLREELEDTFESRSYKIAPEGYLGAASGTKGAIIRKVITKYREKAKSELPELVELIQAEKRGAGNVKRNQLKRNRELFPLTETPQRSLKRRTFEDLLNN